jgi:hypothetical protein
MNTSAICITFGEQSENHVGMVKYGNGLCEHGYTLEQLANVEKKFCELGGKAEFIDLRSAGFEKYEEAAVLILRNGVNILCGDADISDIIYSELVCLDWDKKYFDQRRQKVLNKHARYNLCFGKESREPDYENKKGRVVSFVDMKLGVLKNKLQDLLGEKSFEVEGNFYYDPKKTGIGFHCDRERKKTVGASFGNGREIHWIWYTGAIRHEETRKIVGLNHGDIYIMADCATGHVGFRKVHLRHAAGIKDSKYLK